MGPDTSEKKIRIAVIGHDGQLADAIFSQDELLPYDVVCLCDPTEALDQVRLNQLDIILVDFSHTQAPELGFLDAARLIDPEIIIIAIIGEGAMETAAEALRRGAIDFLQRPLSETKLRVTVKAAAEKRRLRNQLLLTNEELQKANAALKQEIHEKSVIEKELSKSEERYRRVVETQNELIARYLPDGRLSLVNDAYCRYYGRSREELLGQIFLPNIPEEDWVLVKKKLDRLSPDHNTATVEHRVIMPDGSIRWHQWFHLAIFDEGSQIQEFQCVGRDITHFKQAQEALRESRDKMVQTVVERTDELSAATLSRQREFEERLRAERILRSREAILEAVSFIAGRFLRSPSWSEHIHEALDRLGRATEVGRIHIYDNHPGAAGDVLTSLRWEWTADDIPAVMDAIRFENIRLENEGIGHWREQLARGEVIQGDVAELSETERAFLEPLEAKSVVIVPILLGEEWWGFMMIQACRETRRWFPAEIDALKAATDTLGAAIERKRAAEDAAVKQQQLVQADKMVALGTLVSGVAHEINNPTSFIILNVPLLIEIWNRIRPILDEYQEQNGDFDVGVGSYEEMRDEARQLMEDIFKGAKRIKTIVNDLKDFARQRPADTMEDVDINEVLRSAVALVKNTIKKATPDFSVHYEEGLPSVRGNSQRLEQVVINLVINACEAVREKGGGIRVWTSTDAAGKLVLSVQDEGPGILSEHMTHIMDPFFTTKRASGGTGLGLAVSAGIMKDHGGTLEFESSPGEGTTASMVLPLGEG